MIKNMWFVLLKQNLCMFRRIIGSILNTLTSNCARCFSVWMIIGIRQKVRNTHSIIEFLHKNANFFMSIINQWHFFLWILCAFSLNLKTRSMASIHTRRRIMSNSPTYASNIHILRLICVDYCHFQLSLLSR